MTVLMPCWFYDKRDLRRSPSITDGIDIDRESRYRREGARFIINVGTKMGLRYDTMATGVVYFHRFYMFHSFRTFPRYITACCCLFLAGKVEETPKKCKDIIKVAKTFLTEAQFAQFGDDTKEEVMTLERILLQTIKFDLQVDHPYGYLLKYAKCLNGDKIKLQKMVQMAWTFINDSLCTTLCLQWEPEIIAIALMYLAGKLSKFEVTDWNGRTSRHTFWWDLYVEGMSLELLEDICHQVLDLYSTPVPDTPQDSPPATPPTKSTFKKTPTQPVSSPSPKAALSSPVPQKPKEIPVGQPIPRLEPGELKRKVAKSLPRKDSTDAKAPRLSSSSHSKASTSSVSPSQSTADSEGKGDTVDAPTVSSNSKVNTGRPIETVYHSDVVGQYAQPVSITAPAIAESAKPVRTQPSMNPGHSTAVTPTTAPSPSGHYAQTYNKLPFALPEPGASYFVDVKQQQPPPPGGGGAPTMQAPFVQQNASYLSVQPPPPAAMPNNRQPSQPMVGQPLQSHALPLQYQDLYGSQPLPSTQNIPPPPHHQQYPPPPPQAQMHGGPPVVPQYPLPPAQPPANVMLPNVPVPLPNPPNLSQPPPGMPMPPPPPTGRPDMPRGPPTGIGGPQPGAPILQPPRMGLPPPQMPGPSHFIPRPESDPYRREGRGDHPANPRLGIMPVQGHPAYFRDGPPPPLPQDYGPRGRHDHERQLPPYRSHSEYDRERFDDAPFSEYADDFHPNQGHANPYGSHAYDSSSNMPPPYRPFNIEHHRKHERGPRPPTVLKNAPRMEAPTGIPPVRITGSSF